MDIVYTVLWLIPFKYVMIYTKEEIYYVLHVYVNVYIKIFFINYCL